MCGILPLKMSLRRNTVLTTNQQGFIYPPKMMVGNSD